MDDTRGYNPNNSSVLGRLLEELSWEGSKIKGYREGGRGFENVLTAEVFQSLDFLPREWFMGEIIKCAHDADKTRSILYKEIENAEFCLLPGSHYLIPSGKRHQTKLPVQPDGLIETHNVYCVIEAKRIKIPSSFQPEQLAREYVLSLRNCNNRLPLLLLVMGEKPPVNLSKHGRKSIKEAIELYIESVLERSERHSILADEAISRIDEVVCWITWQEIAEIVESQQKNITIEDISIMACVSRVANSVVKSIKWHT
jgi:hypothetical protein